MCLGDYCEELVLPWSHTPHWNMFLLFRTFLLTSKQRLAILPYLAYHKLRQALGGVVTVGFLPGVESFAFELTPSRAPRDIT